MPRTVVRCSMPDCPEEAASKIAAPWRDGRFAELKTYGYACPAHTEAVIALARRRPRPRCTSPGESIGEVAAYELEPA